MGFTEGTNKGSFNGVTEITLVSAPGAAFRRIIKNITIINLNVDSVTLTLYFKDGSVYKTLLYMILDPGDMPIYDEVLVLASTAQSIVGVLGAIPTTNPDFVASYGDAK